MIHESQKLLPRLASPSKWDQIIKLPGLPVAYLAAEAASMGKPQREKHKARKQSHVVSVRNSKPAKRERERLALFVLRNSGAKVRNELLPNGSQLLRWTGRSGRFVWNLSRQPRQQRRAEASSNHMFIACFHTVHWQTSWFIVFKAVHVVVLHVLCMYIRSPPYLHLPIYIILYIYTYIYIHYLFVPHCHTQLPGRSPGRAPAVRPLGHGAERSMEVAGAQSEDCGEGPQDRYL